MSTIPHKHKDRIAWDGVERKNMWKYDKVVENNGYLYALCPQHPKAIKTGYVYLHRVIVENFYGRLLKDDEVVHHADLNKKNNNITNLVIMPADVHSKLHGLLRRKET